MIHISLLPKRTAKQRLFPQRWLIKWLCSCGMYCSLRWSPSRESVAIALLPALSSKHSNSLMKPCGSFYHPVCWPRGRQIKIEEREEGLREREKGENNQRRKDKKNIEGVQKMRVVGAQVRRNKWVFQREMKTKKFVWRSCSSSSTVFLLPDYNVSHLHHHLCHLQLFKRNSQFWGSLLKMNCSLAEVRLLGTMYTVYKTNLNGEYFLEM